MNSSVTLAVLLGAGLGMAGFLSATKRVNEVKSQHELREKEWDRQRDKMQLQIDDLAFAFDTSAAGGAKMTVDRETELMGQIGFLEEQLQLTREENKRLFDRIDALELQIKRGGMEPGPGGDPGPAAGGALKPEAKQVRDGVEKLVSAIRGLDFKAPVPYTVADWSGIREKIGASLHPSWSDDEWANKGRGYAALGLIAPDIEFKKEAANLLTAQLGAAVFTGGEFVFNADASWLGLYDRAAASIELTRVLQDQHFKLMKLLDGAKSLDEVLAIQSLSVGDAALVKVRYMLQDSFPTDDEMRQSLTALTKQQFDAAPSFVREAFIFPFTIGMKFAQKVYEKDKWKSVDAAFAKPPRTTSEILHPEIYLAGNFKPVEIPLDDAPLRGREAVTSGTAGELAIAVLFHQTEFSQRMEELKIEEPGEMPILQEKDLLSGEPSAAAAGWTGDRFVVFPGDDGDHVVWKSRWQTKDNAEAFIAAMEKTLARRYGVKFDSADNFKTASSDSGRRLTLHRSPENGVTIINAGDKDWQEALAERAGIFLPESS